MTRLKIGFLIPLMIGFGCLGWMLSSASAIPVSTDTAVGPGSSDSTIKEVSEAATRFRNRDFKRAKEYLDLAVEKHKKLPPAGLIMAQWFAQVKQAVATRRWLEQTIVDVPDDPEAYAILGDMARREQRWTGASLLYLETIEKLKTFKGDKSRSKALTLRARVGLASVYEARKDWDEAKVYLDAILADDKKNASALQQLGRILFLQEQPNKALEKFQAAHDVDENVLTPEAIIAQLFEASGDHLNAAQWMFTALEKAPQDLKTRIVATRWTLQTGQFDQAEDQAKYALQLDPESLDAQILRGVVALFKKQHDVAITHFQNAYMQSPKNFAASNNLALSLCESEDETQQRRALDYAQMNVERDKNSAEAFSTYGWVLYRTGDKARAEQALQKSLQLSGGQLSPDTAYFIGRLSSDRNRIDEAIQLLESAMKTKRPFSMKPETIELLKELKKKQPNKSKKGES